MVHHFLRPVDLFTYDVYLQDKIGMQCVSNTSVSELMRCIKSQVEGLIPGLQEKELSAMSLGLGHK